MLAFLLSLILAPLVAVAVANVEHYLTFDLTGSRLQRVRKLGRWQRRTTLCDLENIVAVAMEPGLSDSWIYVQRFILRDGRSIRFVPGAGEVCPDRAICVGDHVASNILDVPYHCPESPETFLKIQGHHRNLKITYSDKSTHWPLHHVAALWFFAGCTVFMISFLG
jgi:hypothetical protein